MPARLVVVACLALLTTTVAVAATETRADEGALTTHAERTGFRETGRYDEVIALCPAFERAFPEQVRCFEFGRTPEGRPILAIAASRTGALTAEQARERKLPVLLVQAGIHAGEIDGKDAGFLALRETLEKRAATRALDKVVLLFVPVFSVDGHERFGRWNRPNQRGPEAMGWRTTGQNYNLNRDYAKADAPEMQAMLRLINDWDPILTADLHATNGAQFEHDASVQVEPVNAGDAGLRRAGHDLRDAVIARLRDQGSLPLSFYPSFVTYDDPSSGFVDGVPPPRYSTGYFLLRNRFALLLETHSWKEYPVRVRITRNTVIALLELTARHGRDWLKLALQADADAARLGGRAVPLDYEATEATRTIDFRGYAYTRTPSDISGALMTRYDERTPQIWKVPLRDVVEPKTTVLAPKGGYLVPAAYAGTVGAKLDQHGLRYRRLPAALSAQAVQVFRADSAEFSRGSFEGRQRVTLRGEWTSERHALPAGALFVPIAQANARLLMALLEPLAPDSLAAWGHFNNAFEQKEYMEAYVAEQVAREQLAEDPALRTAFERKLAEDADFAKDASARLDFFYRRHPSWDERFNLYPVLRTDAVPD